MSRKAEFRECYCPERATICAFSVSFSTTRSTIAAESIGRLREKRISASGIYFSEGSIDRKEVVSSSEKKPVLNLQIGSFSSIIVTELQWLLADDPDLQAIVIGSLVLGLV